MGYGKTGERWRGFRNERDVSQPDTPLPSLLTSN